MFEVWFLARVETTIELGRDTMNRQGFLKTYQSYRFKGPYDGSLLLSSRSIVSALNAFTGLETGHVERSSKISRDELQNALWFLESFVSSRAVYYDGTVDERPRQRIAAGTEPLRTNAEKSVFTLAPASPDYAAARGSMSDSEKRQELLADLWAAMLDMQSSVINFSLDDTADQPLINKGANSDAEKYIHHDRFTQALESLARRLADRVDEAERDEAEEAAIEYYDLKGDSGKNNIIGNKCLAALALGGQTVIGDALNAYQKNDERNHPRVTAALINRFRLPYVSRVAQYANGIHCPDASLQNLSERNLDLFLQFIAKEFRNNLQTEQRHQPKSGSERIQTMRDRLSTETDLPLIGLYLLLTCENQSREGLLESAVQFKKKYGELYQFGMEAITTSEARREDINQHIEKEYRKLLDAIDPQVSGEISTRKRFLFRQFLIPAAGSIVAGSAPTVFGGGLSVLETIMSISGGALAGHGLQVVALEKIFKDKVAINKELYTQLRGQFLWSRAALPEVRESVRKIFGRELESN